MVGVFLSEVAVETSNPFGKKSIYINSIKDGPSFSRGSWSIVVVHNNHVDNEVLQTRFNADYKIWVTSMNLKVSKVIIVDLT